MDVDCEDDLRGEVFPCMLAYCAERHMHLKLAPLLLPDADPAPGRARLHTPTVLA